MSEQKAVFRRTTGGTITDFRRIESKTDAETADQTDQADPPKAYGTSDLAKERWAKLRAYFASPIPAKAASTKGQQHTSALREHAFDETPSDCRSQLEKHRNRGDK